MSLGLFTFLMIVVIVGVCFVARYLDYRPVVYVGIVVIGVIAYTVAYANQYNNDHWATCHVTRMDRGGDTGGYRVYTSDCGVLGVTDAPLRFNMHAADTWNKISAPGVYRFHIVGSRVTWRSWFPDILTVEPASSAKN